MSIPARSVDDPLDVLIKAAVGSLLALSVGLWLAGWAVALLFAHRGPGVGLSEIPGVLARLVQHPADPAGAFPTGVREELPGPLAFYATAAVALAALVAVAFYAWIRLAALRARPRARTRTRDHKTSLAWASKAEIAPLVVPHPLPDRVILGRAHGKLIATPPEHSTVVVGPARSGKTTGFAVPAVLEKQGPQVVLSAKVDLLLGTAGARSRLGEVRIYDPTEISGLPAAGWSPLAESATWEGARRVAARLTGVSGATDGLGSGYWKSSAAQLLAPLLFAGATAGAGMRDVVRWARTQDAAEPRAILWAQRGTTEGADELREALEATLAYDPKLRDSTFSTVRTVLEAFEDPKVAASDRPEITCRWLLSGNNTLYLVAKPDDQERLGPVFLALLSEIVQGAYATADELRRASGNPLAKLDPPLQIVLDEAANIAWIPDLDTLASTCGSMGIQLVSIYHDLAQLRARYGQRADTIINAHLMKVFLPGISDPTTLAYASQLIGDEEAAYVSTSYDATGGPQSRTEGTQLRRIVTERELRELPQGGGVAIYSSSPPVKFLLRRYWQERALAAAVATPAAHVAPVPPAGRPVYDRSRPLALLPDGTDTSPPPPLTGEAGTQRWSAWRDRAANVQTFLPPVGDVP